MDQIWGWDEDEQILHHKRRFRAQDFRIIELNGEGVGVIAIDTNSVCMKVNQIFILPQYQRKGIGSECMNRIIKEANQRHVPVCLRVIKKNKPAQAFFRRLGFVQVDETDLHNILERALSPT